MSVPAAPERLPPRALALLALAACALAAAHVLAMRDELVARVPLGDSALFLEWARALRRDGWLAGDAFQAPLYAGFVALVQAACGADPLWVRLAQAPLHAAGCVAVALAGTSLLGRRAGLVGGWLCALHAPLVWSAALVQKPTLAFALGGASAALLAADARRPSTRRALAAGAALGALAWTRQTAVVLVPVALAWILVGAPALLGARPRWRSRALRAAALVAGGLLVSLPFVLRSHALTGELLPGTANLGVNLWIGNHEGADGLYQPLVPSRSSPAHEERDARVLAGRALGRAVSAAEASRYWAGEAWRFAREEPGAWARLALRKLAFVASRAEVMDAEAYELHLARSPLLAALGRLFDFALLAPLALLGLAGRSGGRARAAWLLPAAALALIASLVATFVTARFRLALVPWIAPLAGAGLVDLFALVRRGAWRPLVPRAALLVAWGAVARLPLEQGGDPLATTRANLASALVERGEHADAEREARAALARDREALPARLALARLALSRGDAALAEALLAPVLAGPPALAARGWALLGTAAGERGEHAAAARLLEEALALVPDDPLVLHELARALRRNGRFAEAERRWRRALALDPSLAPAHNDLGLLLERDGRVDEALAHYEAARAADPALVEPWAHLARIRASDPHAQRRDGRAAEGFARRALALDGEDAPDLLDLLAAALAEQGAFEEATRVAERALAGARERGEEELARGLARRLESYRAGRAWRLER